MACADFATVDDAFAGYCAKHKLDIDMLCLGGCRPGKMAQRSILPITIGNLMPPACRHQIANGLLVISTSAPFTGRQPPDKAYRYQLMFGAITGKSIIHCGKVSTGHNGRVAKRRIITMLMRQPQRCAANISDKPCHFCQPLPFQASQVRPRLIVPNTVRRNQPRPDLAGLKRQKAGRNDTAYR